MKFITAKERSSIYKDFDLLYGEAFPKEEQIPLWLLKAKAKKPISDCVAVYDGDSFVGLLNLIYHLDIVFVFFFAVSANLRGRGYGTKILGELQEQSPGKRIALCIETLDMPCPNLSQRIRRKAFYERNGFVPCGYRIVEKGVAYDMLSCGGAVTKIEFQKLIQSYMGVILARILYRYPRKDNFVL